MGIFRNSLIGLDLFASTLTGGIPGETLSGRAGASQRQGRWKGKLLAPLINLIMWDRHHCLNAIQHDIDRANAVIADDSRP